MRLLFQMIAVSVGLLASASAAAQAQPAGQPIRLISPYAAGGVGDSLARLIAESLRSSLGKPVIVENRVGASGRIGMHAAKEAAADGSVLLFTPIAPMAVFPHVYSHLDYDPVTDFEPVSQVATFDFGIAIAPTVRATSLRELVEWLKANPGKATYASPGAGTLPHFCGVLFGRIAGVDLLHIPYKGNSPAIADLMGGHIPMLFTSTQDLVEAHKAGRIRVLATSGAQRSTILSDVPTFKEAGFAIEGVGWYGLYAPAGTPVAVIERVNSAVVAIVQTPEIRNRMIALGLTPTGTSGAALAEIQRRDSALWEPVVKASGFRAEE